MDYIQNTPEETAKMLAAIGIRSTEELFDSIPASIKLQRPLNLPPAMSELEVQRHMAALCGESKSLKEFSSFIGAGSYHHFIPSVVDYLSSRGEFATAYTPYQPEASQGSLQAIFEYQTMICELTGMDISNASHYDGATALADSVMMSVDHTERKTVIVSKALHPEYRTVLKTYMSNLDVNYVDAPYKNGVTDISALAALKPNEAASIVVQNPNFFGCVEDVKEIADIAHTHGALAVVCSNPISLALLQPPGEAGADIASGEGQPLGIEPSCGGPGFGFIAAKEPLLRRMPGRIVGETTDTDGKRGFVLTLQTREQHIRREKASSNICTNQALMALRATIYLSTMGRESLQAVADQCLQKAHYLAESIAKVPGVKLKFTAPFFNEFTVELPKPVAALNKALLARKIIGGLDIRPFYPEIGSCMLVCATELSTKAEMDRFTEELAGTLK